MDGAAVATGGLSAEWTKLYENLIAAFRRAGELLGRGDLFELEHGTALQPLGERLALRQVLRAADLLENALPRHRTRANTDRPDISTTMQAEDIYPIGGYASLSNRGSIESLLPSQLAFMESEADRPDLFDLKYLRDELLYFSRDENQLLRRPNDLCIRSLARFGRGSLQGSRAAISAIDFVDGMVGDGDTEAFRLAQRRRGDGRLGATGDNPGETGEPLAAERARCGKSFSARRLLVASSRWLI